MPVYAKSELALTALLALFIALGGCSRSGGDGQFEISQVNLSWADGLLEISCEQQLQLSPEARDALRHGVTLTIKLEVILRAAVTQTRMAVETHRFELSYLPLSEHYRVSGIGANDVATFPRLRHALAVLSHLDFILDTGPLPAGAYELLARSRLDYRQMPPPMRLPTLFDPSWQHGSGWTSWPLTIEPGV